MTLSQTQSSLRGLVLLASLLGEPISIFRGWNYRQIAMSTWHLLGSGVPGLVLTFAQMR